MLSSGPWGQLIGLDFWLSPCYPIIMFDCHGFVFQSNMDKGERPRLIASFLSDSDSLVVDQCSHNVPGKSSSAAAAHLYLLANACRHASPASRKENTHTHTDIRTNTDPGEHSWGQLRHTKSAFHSHSSTFFQQYTDVYEKKERKKATLPVRTDSRRKSVGVAAGIRTH